MGGPGSGTWVRTGVKPRSDLLPRLSISDLGKAVGLKYPGNVGRLGWTFKGDTVVAYRLTFDGVSVHLHCESGTQQQSIRFASTPCNFGGKRLWFLCPDCDRRAAVVYLVSHRWSCRICGRVRYSCQLEVPAARLERRLLKVRHKLGGSSNLWEPPKTRPKGMHWKTYVNLRNRERRLRHHWLQNLAQYVGSLTNQ